jgi:multidrug resistance efflux pump
MSLEQIQLRIELLTEELKSAQLQQDQLATFEAEVKQALVDLGNVIRRAMASQTVGPRDDPRDARGRRP